MAEHHYNGRIVVRSSKAGCPNAGFTSVNTIINRPAANPSSTHFEVTTEIACANCIPQLLSSFFTTVINIRFEGFLTGSTSSI
ncbi:hypothetical protein ARMSODRAFT_963163, partial [Armillaria solidipes]